ncbi:allophanate hydrolase [Paracoccus sp. (in: a-proteobacteria)]|uniref:5-oxoprolinase subunit C family protein n=1 Tax=Paracoccus sp. TaxID=267 RepID=UPI00289827C0|nr:allophanate hydrolase [Paracoccus sp. (in: a-proteobacteria)]
MSVRLMVRRAGPHVSVQDAGRPGFLRYGVPRSGPMDRAAFAAANLALANPQGWPGIEVSLGGLALDCLAGEIGYAVAGGGFIVRRYNRDGSIADPAEQDQPSWHRGVLKAGQSLDIRPGAWGSWCYLAFAGRLDVPLWLGSAATHSQSGLGGGRLVAGRSLDLTQARVLPPAEIPIPVWARPRGIAHCVAGPQLDHFGPDALEQLAAGPFYMTASYDRMGSRLKGPAILPKDALAIPSGPITRGDVQIAGDGVASLLMADHQTTGGYPRPVTVLDADLDALAQLRPNDPLRFRPISALAATGVARTSRLAKARYFAGLIRRFGHSDR